MGHAPRPPPSVAPQFPSRWYLPSWRRRSLRGSPIPPGKRQTQAGATWTNTLIGTNRRVRPESIPDPRCPQVNPGALLYINGRNLSQVEVHLDGFPLEVGARRGWALNLQLPDYPVTGPLEYLRPGNVRESRPRGSLRCQGHVTRGDRCHRAASIARFPIQRQEASKSPPRRRLVARPSR